MKRIFGIILVLMIFIFAGSAVIVSANEGGNGETKTFKLVKSSVTDGESGVETDRQILLQFSKNVVNISVKEHNTSCFSMADEQGNGVAIEVMMADDQLEREERNNIIIKPVKLDEAKKYTLTINEKLTCKNGETLGTSQKIAFSTIGYITEQPAAGKPGTKNAGKNTPNSRSVWYIAGIVLIAAGVFMWSKRKRQ